MSSPLPRKFDLVFLVIEPLYLDLAFVG
jgi:hypothetical protein